MQGNNTGEFCLAPLEHGLQKPAGKPQAGWQQLPS
jgi:hypothetical protein